MSYPLFTPEAKVVNYPVDQFTADNTFDKSPVRDYHAEQVDWIIGLWAFAPWPVQRPEKHFPRILIVADGRVVHQSGYIDDGLSDNDAGTSGGDIIEILYELDVLGDQRIREYLAKHGAPDGQPKPPKPDSNWVVDTEAEEAMEYILSATIDANGITIPHLEAFLQSRNKG